MKGELKAAQEVGPPASSEPYLDDLSNLMKGELKETS